MSDLSIFTAFGQALERIAPTRPRLRGTSIECATVNLWGFPIRAEYTFTRGCEASRWEPGCDDEAALHEAWVEETDIYPMLDSAQIEAIENELLRKRTQKKDGA